MCDGDILERLESSAAYMDEKSRDRFVVTAEVLHGAIAEIKKLREQLADVPRRIDEAHNDGVGESA